ncbi:MAG: DHA2 family efflux MFS transporter permease subunit [Fischerella sp. CENA71]|nr:DHA2 family efflux MFS transporter permease subunit [Fischerella sp. CENA71]
MQFTTFIQVPLKWVIGFTVSLAAVLEVIDGSILGVTISNMQGTFGATISEIAWVETSNTIADAIMIPLTAWLGNYFGRKTYFIFSLIGFTIASVLCSLSSNLSMLIMSRAVQGLCGGGLYTKAQAILFETFPKAELGIAQSAFGVVMSVGPAIGMILGGYLTDNLNWRCVFFINFSFGVLAVVMSWLFLPKDRDKGKQHNQVVDWSGIAFLASSLISFQIVLQEGERSDWFSSSFIIIVTVVGLSSLGLFIWREFTTKNPAVDLKVLRYRCLAAGSLYNGISSMGAFGTLFVVPIFSQRVLQFTAMQTGLLLAPGVLASAIMMVLVGRLSTKIDARLLMAGGTVGITLVMFQLASITPQTGTDDLFWLLVERAAASTLIVLPLSLAALSPLSLKDVGAGSGLFNLSRQVGGSIGIALLSSILEGREVFHKAVLVEKVSLYNLETNQRLDLLTKGLQSWGTDSVTVHQQALALINQSINIQAAVMSFADIFRIVGVVFLCSLPLLLFLTKVGKEGSA